MTAMTANDNFQLVKPANSINVHQLHASVKHLTINKKTIFMPSQLDVEASRSYSATHTLKNSSGRVTGRLETCLQDNIRRSQERDAHTLGKIRTHYSSKRASADRLPPESAQGYNKTVN
jgi:hypothetical protein